MLTGAEFLFIGSGHRWGLNKSKGGQVTTGVMQRACCFLRYSVTIESKVIKLNCCCWDVELLYSVNLFIKGDCRKFGVCGFIKFLDTFLCPDGLWSFIGIGVVGVVVGAFGTLACDECEFIKVFTSSVIVVGEEECETVDMGLDYIKWKIIIIIKKQY